MVMLYYDSQMIYLLTMDESLTNQVARNYECFGALRINDLEIQFIY